MTAHTLALILLILRIIASGLLTVVLLRQIKNIRQLTTEFPSVRIAVLVLTIVLLVGQIVPIILDAVSFYGTNLTGRDVHPPLLGSAYAVNNAIKDVIIGALLCFLYFRPGANKRR